MAGGKTNIRRVTVEDQLGDGGAKKATKQVADSRNDKRKLSALEQARKAMGVGKKKKKKS